MKEAAFWRALRANMAPYWDATRVEARYPEGVPDLYVRMAGGVSGWIELKASKSWKLPHFTMKQKSWLCRYSGVLLWWMDGEILVFWKGFSAVGRVEIDRLEPFYAAKWPPKWPELAECITSALEISGRG